MTYTTDVIPVCPECSLRDEAEDMTKLCERCGISYCVHFASPVDARYCGNCMVDMVVTESIETKTTIYENAKGEEITRKRQIARSLKLTGTDWLFANKQISSLTDEELLVSIEYHRNIAGAMLLEREERKTEQMNKLSKIKVVMPKRVETEPKVKKDRVEKTEAEKQQAAIAKVLQGLSAEQIAAVIAAAMKGK